MIKAFKSSWFELFMGWLVFSTLSMSCDARADRSINYFFVFIFIPVVMFLAFVIFYWIFNIIEENDKKAIEAFVLDGEHLKGYVREIERKQGLICVPSYDFEDEMFAPIHARFLANGYTVVEQDVNSKFVIYLLKEA